MSNNNQQLENFALDLVEQVREGGNEMERLILENAELKKENEELKENMGYKLCLEWGVDLLLEWKDNMLPFIELGEKIKARGKKQLEDPIANQYGVCFDAIVKTGVKTKSLLDSMADNEILGVWKDVKKKD